MDSVTSLSPNKSSSSQLRKCVYLYCVTIATRMVYLTANFRLVPSRCCEGFDKNALYQGKAEKKFFPAYAAILSMTSFLSPQSFIAFDNKKIDIGAADEVPALERGL